MIISNFFIGEIIAVSHLHTSVDFTLFTLIPQNFIQHIPFVFCTETGTETVLISAVMSFGTISVLFILRICCMFDDCKACKACYNCCRDCLKVLTSCCCLCKEVTCHCCSACKACTCDREMCLSFQGVCCRGQTATHTGVDQLYEMTVYCVVIFALI